MRKILYHGSLEIISTPMYGQGKVYNDYGQGFYCTESLELAKEWSCAEREDGYVNQYEMDEMKIAACAYWKSENVLMMEWRYPEMAFFDHVSFEWKEDRVYMKRWVNMNSQALERPVVTAKICES